ncbi:MAG: hypothetical protein U1E76_18320 [Planctomycetota bacterium]
MPCFKDDELVQYVERAAAAQLADRIAAHLDVDRCRPCGGFVAWLTQTLPQLRAALQVAPTGVVERTIPRVVTPAAPGPFDVEAAIEIRALPAGVRNLAAELERVYQIGAQRLELLMQASLTPPFVDLVGLIEPRPQRATEVLLVADQVPIDSVQPDLDGRFTFVPLQRGVYEIEVQIEGEAARRTPPFDVRLG